MNKGGIILLRKLIYLSVAKTAEKNPDDKTLKAHNCRWGNAGISTLFKSVYTKSYFRDNSIIFSYKTIL